MLSVDAERHTGSTPRGEVEEYIRKSSGPSVSVRLQPGQGPDQISLCWSQPPSDRAFTHFLFAPICFPLPVPPRLSHRTESSLRLFLSPPPPHRGAQSLRRYYRTSIMGTRERVSHSGLLIHGTVLGSQKSLSVILRGKRRGKRDGYRVHLGCSANVDFVSIHSLSHWSQPVAFSSGRLSLLLWLYCTFSCHTSEITVLYHISLPPGTNDFQGDSP